jgi:transcriptional regulator with XRE-family HTH domain
MALQTTGAAPKVSDGEAFKTFGECLKYLRRRARLTQSELGRAVGYSREQIVRLERNQRLPDPTTLGALFIPALDVRSSPALAARLLELAAQAREQTALPPKQKTRVSARNPKQNQTRAQHRAAAEWAELGQGDVITAAREYGRAHDFKRAADVLTDRGALLFNQGKGDDVVAVIDELLTALRRAKHADADTLRRLLTTRGDVLLHTTRAAEAEANYRQAMELSAGAVRAALVYRFASALAQRGRAAEALELARETLAQLDAGHVLLRAQLRLVEGGAEMALSHYDAAQIANQEALALAEQLAMAMPLESAGIRARAHNALGALCAIRGERDAAVTHWQETVATARLAGMRALEYRAQGNLAAVSYEMGKLAQAEQYCAAALDGLQSIGDTQAAAKFVHLGANLAFLRGDVAKSLALAQQACDLKAQTGDRLSYLASLYQWTKALVVMEQLDAARANAERARQELTGMQEERVRAYWLVVLSEIEMLEGNAARVFEMLETARALRGAAQDPKFLNDAANHQAVAALELGRADDAEAVLAQRPANESWETALERELIRGLIAMQRGARATAQQLAEQMCKDATARGYLQLARRAARFAQNLEGCAAPQEIARLFYGKIETNVGDWL